MQNRVRANRAPRDCDVQATNTAIEREGSGVEGRKEPGRTSVVERMAPEQARVELPDRAEEMRRRKLQQPPGMDREEQDVAERHAEDGPVRMRDPERGGHELGRGGERAQPHGRRETPGAPEGRSGILFERDPERRGADGHGDREDVRGQEVQREQRREHHETRGPTSRSSGSWPTGSTAGASSRAGCGGRKPRPPKRPRRRR